MKVCFIFLVDNGLIMQSEPSFKLHLFVVGHEVEQVLNSVKRRLTCGKFNQIKGSINRNEFTFRQ